MRNFSRTVFCLRTRLRRFFNDFGVVSAWPEEGGQGKARQRKGGGSRVSRLNFSFVPPARNPKQSEEQELGKKV